MTTTLDWRYATKADLPLRRTFACTEPEKKRWAGHRLSHPAQGELDVQSWIRTRAICPGQFMLLGLDAQDIAAVGAWIQVDTPADILLRAVAVAMRPRHQGGHRAKEAMDQILSHIGTHARNSGSRRSGAPAD